MLDESEFWELIDIFEGGRILGNDEPYSRLTDLLSQGAVRRVIDFSEMLAYQLHRLDRRVLAEMNDSDGEPLGDDGFLYARCAVVCSGKAATEEVLADTANFVRYTTDEASHAESILDVASNAYRRLTGKEWDHVEQYDYETGSNSAEW